MIKIQENHFSRFDQCTWACVQCGTSCKVDETYHHFQQICKTYVVLVFCLAEQYFIRLNWMIRHILVFYVNLFVCLWESIWVNCLILVYCYLDRYGEKFIRNFWPKPNENNTKYDHSKIFDTPFLLSSGRKIPLWKCNFSHAIDSFHWRVSTISLTFLFLRALKYINQANRWILYSCLMNVKPHSHRTYRVIE